MQYIQLLAYALHDDHCMWWHYSMTSVSLCTVGFIITTLVPNTDVYVKVLYFWLLEILAHNQFQDANGCLEKIFLQISLSIYKQNKSVM